MPFSRGYLFTHPLQCCDAACFFMLPASRSRVIWRQKGGAVLVIRVYVLQTLKSSARSRTPGSGRATTHAQKVLHNQGVTATAGFCVDALAPLVARYGAVGQITMKSRACHTHDAPATMSVCLSVPRVVHIVPPSTRSAQGRWAILPVAASPRVAGHERGGPLRRRRDYGDAGGCTN